MMKMLPHLEKVSEALQVFNLIVNRLLPPPHQQLTHQTKIKPRPAKPGVRIWIRIIEFLRSQSAFQGDK
jgi:hypothetical protein